jgi:hypothetical protein
MTGALEATCCAKARLRWGMEREVFTIMRDGDAITQQKSSHIRSSESVNPHTLKEECTRRMLIPFALDAMRAEMELFARWYNEWRPHRSLGGRTPDEVYASRTPARAGPRFEPRARYPTHAKIRGQRGDELELKVDYLEGRRHLPIITLQRAA